MTMASRQSANTLSARPKRKAPSTAWKPGQSGNPAGAPKRGESWAEIIKRIGEMEPGEAAAKFGEIAKQLRSLPNGVTLKELVVMRVYAAMLFEPTSALWGHMMDRADGEVGADAEGAKRMTIRVIYDDHHAGDRDPAASPETPPSPSPDN